MKKVKKFFVFVFTIMLVFSMLNITIKGIEGNTDYFYEEIYVETDNGTLTEAYKYCQDLSASDYDAEMALFENYSSFVILQEPSLYYNCHAFAFYYKGTADFLPPIQRDACWLLYPEDYINDGSYVEVGYSNIREGTIVTYWNNNNLSHSGVIECTDGIINLIYSQNLNVISKMGRGPLVRHTLYDAYTYYVSGETTMKFYSNYFHIISNNTSIGRYDHRGYCNHCNQYVTESHVLIEGFSNYRCKYCNYTTSFAPIIQGNQIYYLFANDQTNTLRTYEELQIYLIKNNYFSYLNELNNIKKNEVK